MNTLSNLEVNQVSGGLSLYEITFMAGFTVGCVVGVKVGSVFHESQQIVEVHHYPGHKDKNLYLK